MIITYNEYIIFTDTPCQIYTVYHTTFHKKGLKNNLFKYVPSFTRIVK